MGKVIVIICIVLLLWCLFKIMHDTKGRNDSCAIELDGYSDEELKAELKRRREMVLAERESVRRCRHCVHFNADETMYFCKCMARTYQRRNPYDRDAYITYNYRVKPSQRACDIFKEKENK